MDATALAWTDLSRGGAVHIVGDPIPGTSVPLQQVFYEFGRCLRESIPWAHAPDEWHALRVEFWGDSGRIIAGPEVGARFQMSDRVRCEVHLPFLVEVRDRLDASGMTDAAFSRAIAAEHVRCATSLVRELDLGPVHPCTLLRGRGR